MVMVEISEILLKFYPNLPPYWSANYVENNINIEQKDEIIFK
jgi:hypothetical protein